MPTGWPGLNKAVQVIGVEKVIAPRDYTTTFVQWLRANGYEAEEERTTFEGELSEINENVSG